jgi:hypothetical protein
MGDMVPADAPRPALDVGEAARLIVVRIRVTAVHPPGPGDGQDLPVVHFHGVSQSLDDWDNVDDEDSDARGRCPLALCVCFCLSFFLSFFLPTVVNVVYGN